jgi:ubiquinone/menaquinone biosynthesis C-methylase UbiE
MDDRESQACSTPAGKKEKWTSGDAYEVWMARWSRLLAPRFLDWLEAPPRAAWLDLCCGTGILSLAIAERCWPARVLGVDRAAPQIEFARRHRAGSRIEYQLGDATALPFANHSFDACVCGLGLNFIADPAKALHELRRVTRPGGTIGAYVWEYSGQARFLREFWDAAAAVDPQAVQFDQGRRFPICTPEGLRSAFVDAGLANVAVRSLDIVTHFKDFEDYWSPFLLGQGSGPTYLEQCDECIRVAIRDRLRATLPVNADGSIKLGARALAVRASRP